MSVTSVRVSRPQALRLEEMVGEVIDLKFDGTTIARMRIEQVTIMDSGYIGPVPGVVYLRWTW